MQKYLSFLVLALLFTACSPDKEQALGLLSEAQARYESGAYPLAKESLDSLKAKYPKQFDVQKDGLMLMRRIELKEQQRNLAFSDSTLTVLLPELDEMKKGFVFEKSEYDDQGKYLDRSQLIENNIARSYIRSGVREDGAMYIASMYYGGSALKHNQLKVSVKNGDYAETQVISADGGANYSFQDLGMTTEVVTYQNERDNGVIAFLYYHEKETIKAEYLGGKRAYSITVSATDKKALVKTANLSALIKQIDSLQKEMVKSQERITYLESKLVE